MTMSLVGTKSALNLSVTASILAGVQPIPYDTADQADASEFARRLSSFFHACADGAISFNISATQGGVAAAGVLTLTGTMTAADTITIGNTTLTAHASTQDATHFAVGASATATAANIVTCINANTTLNTYLSPSSLAGVMTITCLVPGKIGNGISTAKVSTQASWGATYMTSGAGTLYTSTQGF